MIKYRKGIDDDSGNQNVLSYTMVCAKVFSFNVKRFLAENDVEL